MRRGLALGMLVAGGLLLLVAGWWWGFAFAQGLRRASAPSPTPLQPHTTAVRPQSTSTPRSTSAPVWRAHVIPGVMTIPYPAGWRALDYTWVTEQGISCPAVELDAHDGQVQVFVEVRCDLREGIAGPCPAGSETVHQRGGEYLVRYPDTEEAGLYRYTTAGKAQVSDEQGTRAEMMCAQPPTLHVYPDRGAVVVAQVYARTPTAARLAEADRVVWTLWAAQPWR